jgi:drug/metabolite transporter (DMT)-like permease
MPWYTAQLGNFKSIRILMTGTQAQNEVFVYNPRFFRILLVGGVSEFLGSTFMLLSYRSALALNINQGICSSIISFNSISVTIASYTVFRERVSGFQSFGILLIVLALTIIVFYQPESSIPLHNHELS